ncbi:retrovirus-related Pol polyprotein from transposon opus [Trichonephila clavipes]|nr:retrovirus-related Pol polyprotein from transposon opus [Trichonephila clavipes]
MSFGLSGAAPNFQKAIDIILKPVIGRFVMVYLDDVNITSPSFNEHIDHLNQDVFNKVKRALTEAPVLQLLNFQEQFSLFTDASGAGIGAMLNQNHRPIAFLSRTPNKAERNYKVTERECLAVIWALYKFKTYFGSLPMKVITDHAVLTKPTNGKNLSSWMIRWALTLSEFNIEWEHRPCVQNVVAYVLSRNPVGNMDGSQTSCAALRALALNSREQLIREQRVLEVRNNNLIIWKMRKRVTVNIDQGRVYHPRQSDAISSDSHVETLYEGQKSSNGSSRSHPGKSKRSRKISSEERNTVHCRSHTSTRYKAVQATYRKEQTRKVWTIRQGPGDKETKSRTIRAAERRPIRSKQATAVRPCPYYLRSRVKQPEGIPEERRSNGIDRIPQNNIRRRSLSMEALDGNPVDRSE